MDKVKKSILYILILLTLVSTPVFAATTKECHGIGPFRKCTVIEPGKKPTTIDEISDTECSNNYGGVVFENGQFVVKTQCDQVNEFKEQMDGTYNQMHRFFVYIWSGSLVIAVICIAFGAVQLAMSAGNAQKKQKAWGRIKVSLLVVALLGGISTIIVLAFGLFK